MPAFARAVAALAILATPGPASAGAGLFSQAEASSPPVLRLEVASDQSPYLGLYSVYEGGTVLYERVHEVSNQVRSASRKDISPLEVLNLVARLEEERVVDYKAADLKRFFPDGPPLIADGVMFTLTIRADVLSRKPGSPPVTSVSIRDPEYLTRYAPTFSAARGLSELEKFLRGLFR